MVKTNRTSAIVWLLFSLFICIVILITYYQYKNYWESTITRVQTVDFNILHATLPYAIAFLEEDQRSDLIEQVLNSNYGFFSMAYTDMKGNIKFSTKAKFPHVKLNQSDLDHSQFSYVFKKPFPQQCSAKSPYEDQAFVCGQKSEKEVDAYGKIYLLRRDIPLFAETILSRLNLESLGLKNKQIDDYVLNIIINIMFILLIFISCIFLVKFINKNETLIKQKHEGDRRILELEMDSLSRDIKAKENSLNEANELIKLYEVDNKSKDDDYFKLKKHADIIKFDLSQLNDQHTILNSKYQQKDIEWSSIVKKDELENLIGFLWPKLIFESKAIKEMRKLYSTNRYLSEDICHTLSFIESSQGNFDKLKRHYIVESWKDSKEPIIKIKFNPRRRIYIHSGKDKTHIVLIDPCKTKETESMAGKYLREWTLTSR